MKKSIIITAAIAAIIATLIIAVPYISANMGSRAEANAVGFATIVIMPALAIIGAQLTEQKGKA